MRQKIVLLLMVVCMAIPCFGLSPYNIWTKPTPDWLTGQNPAFDPAWAWMKWMDGQCATSAGTAYYVDINNGADTNTGLTWERAFKTIQVAADAVDDFDTIYVKSTSTITETVTTSSADMGVRIIGVSLGKTNPNWQSSGAGTNTLIIHGPNTEVRNFLFTGATRTVPYISVQYTANATIIANCYFHGNNDSHSAIQFYGAPPQCKLLNNHITAFGGAMAGDIAAVWGNYGVMSANDYEICGNWFTNNTDHIDLQSGNCLYQGNHFNTDGSVDDAATVIDTYGIGVSVGFNTIVGNYFGDTSADMTVAAGYTFVSTDMVAGNFCSDGMYPKIGPEGNAYYVDSDNGDDDNSGLSWGQAFLTIQAGVTAAGDGDTIYIRGVTSFQEDIDTGIAQDNVKLIGVNNGKRRPNWLSTLTTTSQLTLNSLDWEISNLRFTGVTNSVALVRVVYAGTDVGAGSVIKNCYFHGGGDSLAAIEYNGGGFQNDLIGNHFTDFGMANAAGQAAVYSTNHINNFLHAKIIDNWFSENVDNLIIQANTCLIKGNTFQSEGDVRDATIILNTLGGNAVGNTMGNIVTQNTFGDPKHNINNTNGYYSVGDDQWAGNFCTDGLNEGNPVYPRNFIVTSSMGSATWNTAAAHEIAAVTGTVRMKIVAECTVADIVTVGTNGTIALGYAGNTAAIWAAAALDSWDLTEVAMGVTAGVPTFAVGGGDTGSALTHCQFDIIAAGGVDVGYTIATNAGTTGSIVWHIWWEPLSADGLVTAGAGGAF